MLMILPTVPLQSRRPSLLIKARPTLLLLETLIRISNLIPLARPNRALVSLRNLTRATTMAPEMLMVPLPRPRHPLLPRPSLTEQESKKTGKSTNCVSFAFSCSTSTPIACIRLVLGFTSSVQAWVAPIAIHGFAILGAGRSLLSAGLDLSGLWAMGCLRKNPLVG